MMMYTILMFDGSVKHFPENMGKQIAKAKHMGDACVTLSTGELIDCKAISNILPFKKWRMEEETKMLKKGKELYICDFGQVHHHYEKCQCHAEGLDACTLEAASLLKQPPVNLSPVTVKDSSGKIIETL